MTSSIAKNVAPLIRVLYAFSPEDIFSAPTTIIPSISSTMANHYSKVVSSVDRSDKDAVMPTCVTDFFFRMMTRCTTATIGMPIFAKTWKVGGSRY